MLKKLIRIHKCERIANVREFDGDDSREIWIGKLIELLPIPYHSETHCIHIRTPGRNTVMFMNCGDAPIMAGIAYVLNGDNHINKKYVEKRVMGWEKKRLTKMEDVNDL